MEKGWTEPADVREILGLGWVQQTLMAVPCPVVLTFEGAREALTLGGARVVLTLGGARVALALREARVAQNWTEPARGR